MFDKRPETPDLSDGHLLAGTLFPAHIHENSYAKKSIWKRNFFRVPLVGGRMSWLCRSCGEVSNLPSTQGYHVHAFDGMAPDRRALPFWAIQYAACDLYRHQ